MRQKQILRPDSVKFKGKKSGAGPRLKDTGKRQADFDRDEELSKKLKEDRTAKAQQDWVEKTMERKFTCERQIDCRDMDGNPLLDVVQRKGLSFFFRKVDGYRPKTVKQFYCNMVVNEDKHEIVSRVGNKTVVVTPNSIAAYLGNYQRPDRDVITYPKKKWEVRQETIVNTLVEDPGSFDYKNRKFSSGALKELYRNLNTIMHYNLTPLSNEKRPAWKDGEFLYIFGAENETVDWARWRWVYIRDFRNKGLTAGNLPFPVMITKLCEEAGHKPKDDPIDEGLRGPFTAASLKKSKSLSKQPRPETFGFSKPTAKKGKERNEQWYNILFCRQSMIMDKQANQERRLKRVEKMMGKIWRVVSYVGRKMGESSNDPYVETAEDLEVDTEEEEDGGEHDFNLEDDDEEGDD